MTLIDDILDGFRLRSTVVSRMTLLGDWGYAKDALAGVPFHILLSGEAWVEHDGTDQQHHLAPGDIVVLPGGDPHRLVSAPGAPAVPFSNILAAQGWTHWHPGMRFKAVDLRLGSGRPKTIILSGVFAFGDPGRNPLLAALPPVLTVSANETSNTARAVASTITLLDTEILSGNPGAEIISTRLADILFIQVIRHHLASAAELPRGWLRGMAEPDMASVLALMHREPERAWSVEALGREVGMSRSRFATRFQAVVGQAPLEYLTQWRMYLAAGRLLDGGEALSAVAASVGYRSDVAFSKAFKRWAGCSPAQYRRAASQSFGTGGARGNQ